MTFETSLRLILEQDEGIVHEIYEDHMGNPTCGIGHLLVETDREYGWPIGTEISEARVTQLYNQDVSVALKDARWLQPDFEVKDWSEAAAQLRDSNLYRQTTNRTERHARRLEGIK